MQDPHDMIADGAPVPLPLIASEQPLVYSPPRALRGPSPVLHVASGSPPASVAGAIAGTFRDQGFCELQAIGAGAVNQTIKAIAIARGYMAPAGIDLVCIPAFFDVAINGEERTAIKFKVESRRSP